MKVVLAHDFIRHGGAERSLEQMHALWPEAPIHTLLAESNPAYANWDIRSSCLQGLVPPRFYRWPLPLYPGMVNRLSLDPTADLIVSSSVSFMKSLRAPAGVPHLSYVYRPMMFAYHRQGAFLARYPFWARPVLKRIANSLGRWDRAHADAPDRILACSQWVADQIHQHWNRQADVLYPPVDIDRFALAGEQTEPQDYFLCALRLESYKRVEIAVQACTRLGLPLRVAGQGPALKSLRGIAGTSVQFLGYVDDAEMPTLVAGCRAFLFPAEEDFGIAPVEALAAGRPVVAFGAGGCLETVEHGVSGLHFPEQTVASLLQALAELEQMPVDADAIRASALRFRPECFRAELLRQAELLVQEWKARPVASTMGDEAS